MQRNCKICREKSLAYCQSEFVLVGRDLMCSGSAQGQLQGPIHLRSALDSKPLFWGGGGGSVLSLL